MAAKRNTRKKTTAQKKLSGTSKPSRTQVVLPPVDPDGVETMFDGMTAAELLIFEKLKRQLGDMGILQQVDSYLLTNTVVTLVKLQEAAENFRSATLTAVYGNGTFGPSPELMAYEKMSKMALVQMQLLGLAPKSRKIILGGVMEKPKEKTPDVSLQKPTHLRVIGQK